jgi:branched-chain amino acid transport system permease protein
MLVEQVVNGLVVGGVYALIALGFTLIFGVLEKFNFAHPEVFMLGGFVAIGVLETTGSVWLVLPAVIAVSILLGLSIELISFRLFKSADAQTTAALSSLAVGLILGDVVHNLWGSDPRSLGLPEAIVKAGISIGGVHLTYVNLLVLAATLLLMIGLHYLIGQTRLGRAIRAAADNPGGAELLGVSLVRATQATFVFASALAGTAGLLVALRTGVVSADVGLTFGLKAFAIMALGGLGDLRGSVLAGLLVGVLESVAFHFGMGRLTELIVWILMMAVLLFRPYGLFGQSHTRVVRP